jgi:ADP-heptose:LPS heptosyltransferase
MPILAIHPGSGSLKKNWPVDRWIRAGRELAASHPQMRLALVTGEAEHERGITAELVEGWREIDFLHWDQLPLAELASNLSQTAAFIGHDSGISHLAAACGVACLLFFGPTDPATWAPRNAGVQVFTEPSGDLAQLAFEAGYARIREFVGVQASACQ